MQDNETSKLGDGMFPAKVFYWRRKQRSKAWIEEHNPFSRQNAGWFMWASEFYEDQSAGAYSWKRSNVHRAMIICFSVAILCWIVSFTLTMVGGMTP